MNKMATLLLIFFGPARGLPGAPVRQWERIPGRRAESLDCVVYAIAVRSLENAKVERREQEVQAKTLPKASPQYGEVAVAKSIGFEQ